MNNPALRRLCSMALFLLLGNLANAQLKAAFTATPLSGCSPLLVSFTDASTGNPDQWEWDLGNGTTSFFQHPSVTYFNPGTYTVKLTVKKNSGAQVSTEVKTAYITVYASPTVGFTASATGGCYPLTVGFVNNSLPGSGTISSYAWDFGDGNTSNLASPVNTYTSAGSFNVILHITNSNGCSATYTAPSPINIFSGVKAGFTLGHASRCQAPAGIPFTNTSTGTGTLTYKWDFGDGGSASDPNPVHIYSTPGNYTVRLITTNNSGCSDTARQSNIAVGLSTVDFNAPAVTCLNEPVALTDKSSPPATGIQWDFGDGIQSADLSPTHAYTALGNYTITMTADLGFCVETKTKNIQAIPRPAGSFSSPVQASCKAPFTASFAASAPGATQIDWDFGDGTTGTGPNPSHTYLSEGSFPVTLVVTNSAGCRESIRQDNFINIQKPIVELVNLPAEDCVPYTFSPFLHISSVVPITDFLWDFGDGSTATGLSPSHTYTVKGTYTVTLTWKTADGCQETLVKTDFVKVGNHVTVDFSGTPNDVCASTPVLFTDLTGLGTTEPIDKWYWQFGDNTSSDQPTILHAFADTGRFAVTLTVWSNGCPSFLTKFNYVHVKPPIARFKVYIDCSRPYARSFGNESLYDPSLSPLSFSWDFGDGATSTLLSPTHTYAAQGKYIVTLTVVDGGCSHTTSAEVIVTETPKSMTATDNAVCPGGTVTFDAQVGDPTNIIGYHWFSDYGSLLQITPTQMSQTFTTPGLYNIYVSIVDTNRCITTFQKQVLVIKTMADMDPPAAACINSNVAFSDRSIEEPAFPIRQRTIDWGDGSPPQTNPGAFSHVYTRGGSFSITLSITDSKGCTSMATKNILIADPVADFNSPDIASCTGKDIHFTSLTDPGYSYQWDFGDGQQDNSVNPLHQYAGEGSFTVSLQVKDQYGCTASVTKSSFVQVNNPVPQFSINANQSNCPPLVVSFTNQSQNMISAEWDFGDGNTSTLVDPVHFYTYPGEYWPILKVTSKGGCVAIIQDKKITINGPRGQFSYDKKEGCAPLTVSFTGVTNDNVTFIWDFNDGATDITSVPTTTYTFTRPGSYLPKMILKDVQGCQVPINGPDMINVYDVAAGFTTDMTSLCDRGFIQFTDASATNDVMAAYQWDLGDGATAGSGSFRHEYTAPGSYTVQLTVTTRHGCTSSVTSPVPLEVVPSPIPAITGPHEACQPASFTYSGLLTNSNPYPLTWSWDMGNGQTASVQNPPPAGYANAGSYTVSLRLTNSYNCSNTATFPIVIHPLPAIDAGPDIVLCRDVPRTLQATGADSYTWSSAESLSCTTCPVIMVNPASTARYYVEGNTLFGCKATDSVLVTVQQRFDISADKGDTLCLGESYRLRASGADHYSWTPAAGLDNPSLADPLATPQATTLYRVIGRDNNNCFEDTAYVPVTVYPIPQIRMDEKKTIPVGTTTKLTPSLSPDVTDIRWEPSTWLDCTECPAPVSNAQQTTRYKLTVTNEGGCTAEAYITIFVVCGGENMFLPNSFSPNGDGMNDVFYPMGKGITRIKNFRVFDRWGEKVFEQYAFQANDLSKGWDGKIKGVPASPDVYVYIIQVVCANGQELTFKGDVTLIR